MFIPNAISRRGAVLFAAGLLWAGCGRIRSDAPERKGGGGELRVVLPAEPRDLDPNATQDEMGLLVAPNLYSRLVMIDADSNVLPDLAERWEVGKGGLEYIFHLREGVRWHDGHPFRAADVRWTLKHQSPRPTFASDVYRKIAAVETPDERTVIVRLREPWAPFLPMIASYGAFILHPPHSPREVVPRPSPIGTGPFKFVAWEKGRRIVLAANPDFFRRGPFLDRVVYEFEPDHHRGPQRLIDGKSDLLVVRPPLDSLPRLARSPELRVATFPGDGQYSLMFNLRRRPFQDLRVRRAVNQAIDRPALLARALYGYGTPGLGFYPPALAWAFNAAARAPELDPAGARSQLDAAGLPPDARGVRFRANLLTPAFSPFPDVAREVAGQLAAVGVALQVEEVPGREWIARTIQRHDFDIALMGGSLGPDPETLNMRFGSRSPMQFIGYESPELDAALAEGARELTLSRRARAYFRVQEILARDLPVAPLVDGASVTVSRREVTGLPQMEARGLVAEFEFSLVRLVRSAPAEGGR
ncbi:MAG TPA: ABC transporter substrate-binding protein [Thermoanaerobaculia bacterium]|nr:ABC transporter substrate-binding protein [Thermoanaerobaculia bacterium]